MASLYNQQTAAVRTDRLSRSFVIERGTKQGDPLSSLLFNALLEDVVRNVQRHWQSTKLGIPFGHNDGTSLTNLRFADDILLIAKSFTHVRNMLQDLSTEASKAGLEIHPDKTKILSNATRKQKARVPKLANINGMAIEVLPFHGSVKYLGRQLSFDNPNRTEVEHRIGIAWKRFFAFKHEMTSKTYPLKHRIRLFHSIITPSVLYGNAAWTLTQDLEFLLRRTQRRMLRMIISSPRRRKQLTHDISTNTTLNDSAAPPTQQPHDNTSNNNNHRNEHNDNNEYNLETWTEWVQRATRTAESYMGQFNIDDWITIHRRSKWRCATRIAKQEDTRWTKRAALWEPEVRTHTAKRRWGRQHKRWTDDIQEYLTKTHTSTPKSWKVLAADETTWKKLEEGYVHGDWRSKQSAEHMA